MHMCTGELLNNSQWVQTVWVSCSRCSDGWYSLKFWLHNMSAHHNWWSFLSILMFIRENRKHIGLFWWYKFMLFFFSASTVCVSFRGYRNVLVYLRLVLAPNDLYLVFSPHFFYYISLIVLYLSRMPWDAWHLKVPLIMCNVTASEPMHLQSSILISQGLMSSCGPTTEFLFSVLKMLKPDLQ